MDKSMAQRFNQAHYDAANGEGLPKFSQSINFPVEVADRLRAWSRSQRRSVSSSVVYLVEQALKREEERQAEKV